MISCEGDLTEKSSLLSSKSMKYKKSMLNNEAPGNDSLIAELYWICTKEFFFSCFHLKKMEVLKDTLPSASLKKGKTIYQKLATSTS